ncbi:MAG: hypothetical protein ACFFHV_02280 [Promethearchaeota archaeon]
MTFISVYEDLKSVSVGQSISNVRFSRLLKSVISYKGLPVLLID